MGWAEGSANLASVTQYISCGLHHTRNSEGCLLIVRGGGLVLWVSTDRAMGVKVVSMCAGAATRHAKEIACGFVAASPNHCFIENPFVHFILQHATHDDIGALIQD